METSTEEAANYLIVKAQQEEFPTEYQEYQMLKQGKMPKGKTGPFLSYDAFIEKDSGLIRCGGRLSRFRLTFGGVIQR